MKTINWIITKLEWCFEFVMALKNDKWWHIGVGFAIWVYCMLTLPIESENWLFLASWFVAALAGAFKEIVIDKWFKLGTPDINDFWATISIPSFITSAQFLVILLMSLLNTIQKVF